MALREEVEQLRDRVAELEQLLGIGEDHLIQIRQVIKATPTVCKLIGMLRKARSVMSREHLFIAIYGDRNEADQPTDLKIIDVFVSKARAALEPHGIEITTTWGAGYALRPDGKQKLGEMMRAKEQVPEAA